MLSETLFISRGGKEEGVRIPSCEGDCVKGAELQLCCPATPTLGSSFCSHLADGKQTPLIQSWVWQQGGLQVAPGKACLHTPGFVHSFSEEDHVPRAEHQPWEWVRGGSPPAPLCTAVAGSFSFSTC